MKAIWTGAILGLTLALLGSAQAGEKKVIDKAKLVGVWEVTKGETAPEGATIEFTKDGKLMLNASQGGKTLKMDGTYKVDGAKLMTVLKFGPKEKQETMTVPTLTDTTLVTVDEEGKKDTFKRKASK